jgi:cytochrome c biogenesis protein CcmG/thiol:disulfide interchange protein DsbE
MGATVGAGGTACTGPTDRADTTVPDAQLVPLDGGPETNLRGMLDRPTVINLWASYCTPCRAEMPLLEAQSQKWSGKVDFLGVTDDPDLAVARRSAATAGVTYPLYQDGSGRVLQGLGVVALPATFIVDRHGRVVASKLGTVTPSDIDAALSGLVAAPGPSS